MAGFISGRRAEGGTLTCRLLLPSQVNNDWGFYEEAYAARCGKDIYQCNVESRHQTLDDSVYHCFSLYDPLE